MPCSVIHDAKSAIYSKHGVLALDSLAVHRITSYCSYHIESFPCFFFNQIYVFFFVSK